MNVKTWVEEVYAERGLEAPPPIFETRPPSTLRKTREVIEARFLRILAYRLEDKLTFGEIARKECVSSSRAVQIYGTACRWASRRSTAEIPALQGSKIVFHSKLWSDAERVSRYLRIFAYRTEDKMSFREISLKEGVGSKQVREVYLSAERWIKKTQASDRRLVRFFSDHHQVLP